MAKLQILVVDVAVLPYLSDIYWDLFVVDEAHTFSSSAKYARNICGIKRKATLCITAFPEKNLENICSLFQFEYIAPLFGATECFLPTSGIVPDITFGDQNQLRKLKIMYRSELKQCILNTCVLRGSQNISDVVPYVHMLEPSSAMLKVCPLIYQYTYQKNSIGSVFRLLSNVHQLNSWNTQLLRCLLKNQDINSLVNSVCTNVAFANSTDKCHICLHKFQDPLQLSTCQHVYCQDCLLQWYSVTSQTKLICPICKQLSENAFLPRFRDVQDMSDSTNQQFAEDFGKTEYVCSLIEKLRCGTQMLIYTQYIEYSFLYRQFSQIHSKSVRSTGFMSISRDQIKQDIIDFKNHKFDILILNINGFSDGFDFPNVSELVISDFSNIIDLKQASQRIGCHRLGSKLSAQETHVTVVMFKKSIEAWLYDQYQANISISTLPDLRQKLASKKQLLQLEYFLTHDVLNTRMFKLHKFAQKMNTDVVFKITYTKRGKPKKQNNKSFLQNQDVFEAHMKTHDMSYVFVLNSDQVIISRINDQPHHSMDIESLFQ